MKTATRDKKFKDENVKPVYRHWLCPQEDCEGEMIGTGHGMTTMGTDWQHRCNKCRYEEWTNANYPKITYL